MTDNERALLLVTAERAIAVTPAEKSRAAQQVVYALQRLALPPLPPRTMPTESETERMSASGSVPEALAELREAAYRLHFTLKYRADTPTRVTTDRTRLLSAITAVQEALVQPPSETKVSDLVERPMREQLCWAICCGKPYCDADNRAPDHDISADHYAEKYGCESDGVGKEADAVLSLLKSSEAAAEIRRLTAYLKFEQEMHKVLSGKFAEAIEEQKRLTVSNAALRAALELVAPFLQDAPKLDYNEDQTLSWIAVTAERVASALALVRGEGEKK